MQSEAPAKKGLAERAALATLVGLSVLSVLGVAMVTVYLNRVNDSASTLSRTEPMPGYVGRPGSVVAENGNSPINFLVMVTASDSLHSVVVANLSASRRSLTLLAFPADLVVSDTPVQTLRSAFGMDPSITTRAMEGLTGARMDHQIQIDLDGFTNAIDAVGGVEMDGEHLSAKQALQQVSATNDTTNAAIASAALIQATMVSAEKSVNILDPSKVSQVIRSLAPCLKVDSGLTAGVIESLLVESSVHSSETRLWPLTTVADPIGSIAESESLETVRSALATADLVGTAQYQTAAFLPQEKRK